MASEWTRLERGFLGGARAWLARRSGCRESARGTPFIRRLRFEPLERRELLSASAGDAAATLGATSEYVLITSSDLVSSFQPLVNEKLARGLTAEIITTEYIYDNYTGTENNDSADMIRSFIRDAYQYHETKWVLLGGDVEVVPTREVYVSTSDGIVTDLPSDLYYACLDGPWNGNGNSYWGEPTDGTDGWDIDLTAEVYVGRAPASNVTEAGYFVAKTIQYETQAHPNVKTSVFLGEHLYAGTYGDWSIMDIRDSELPADWKTQANLTELYESVAPWTAATLISKLNASPNMVHDLGHGSETFNAKLDNVAVAGLTNAFPFFMYSQACDSGAFDASDSIAEKYVVSEHGAFAVVMNSRDGWYDQTGQLQYSHYFAKEFWDAVFHENKLHLGEANQDSKEDNLFRVGSTGYYRYIYFETNLLGDPEASFQLGPGVIIPETGDSTDVAEGGATDSYSVVLTSRPSADVVVTLAPDSQVSVAPTTLTFTPSDWDVPQTVVVSAVDDSLAEGLGLHTGTIAHQVASSDPAYHNLMARSVTARITDNDTPGVLITETEGGTFVVEGGATDSYDVVLACPPLADVTVSIIPDSQVSVAPTTLIFTPANWNVAQTVVVGAVDDPVAEYWHSGMIAHQVASADVKYNALPAPDVWVSIEDNDTAGVRITESGGSTAVTEGGATDSYTVVLSSQPTADVTISITPDSQVSVEPTTLIFTAANWNVARTVVVSAVDDAVVEGTHTGTITHTVASSDWVYDGLMAADVAVQITEAPIATWDGEGADDNWMTAANWANDVAPVPGNRLVFAGTTRPSSTNDFPGGTSFYSITFANGGFTLSGINAVTLNPLGGIAIDNILGYNKIDLPITLGSTCTFAVVRAGTLELGLGAQGPMFGSNKFVAGLFGATAGRVTVNGDLDLGSSTALEFIFGAGDPFQVGTYTLASYTGTLTGMFSSVTNLGAYVDKLTYPPWGLNYGDGTNDAITLTLLAGLVPGDANEDGYTDALDYVVVSNHYGTTPALWTDGDVNGDNIVDALDYVEISNNYGLHAPEPGTLVLLEASDIMPPAVDLPAPNIPPIPVMENTQPVANAQGRVNVAALTWANLQPIVSSDLDRDAAGHGRFVDRTQTKDEQFRRHDDESQRRAAISRAFDRLDLLTAITSELGHVAGIRDIDQITDNFISGSLKKGVRRQPALCEVDAVFAELALLDGQRVSWASEY